MAADGVEDWVPADGFISDDSSFYGDEDEKTELEAQAAAFDPGPYWGKHNEILSVMAYRKTAQATPASKPTYNLYKDNPAGRQLSETVPEFLSRLPPRSSQLADIGPWLYIANPHHAYRPTSEDLSGFKQVGQHLLEEFSHAKASIESSMAGKAKATITKKLTPLRKKLEADIFAAAKGKGVRSGKWMLFPSGETVNQMWALVAKAVADGELGTAAKVATDDGSGDQEARRLICVYTEDFGDRGDVRRVLERLVGLGLVRNTKGTTGQEGIVYYKADAMTHLEVTRNNEWGLKPSLYSSREILLGEGRK